MTTNINLPPQALEAEMAVLGSMMIEREAVERALDILAEKDFYQEAHRKVFRAMTQLVAQGQAVDVVTVGEELRRRKLLDDVGGKGFLIELTNRVSTAAHVEHYSQIVKEKSVLRDLIHASHEAVAACYSEDKPASQVLDEAQSRILRISETQGGGEIIEMKDLVHPTLERIEQAHRNKQPVTGISSGLTKLDKNTTGFQKGELILIAGRPGHGKTALGLNIAVNVTLAKKPRAVLFFSLEMNRHALIDRLVAPLAHIDIKNIRTGYFARDKFTDVTNALARLQSAPLSIADRPGMTIMAVRSEARRLSAKLDREGGSLGMVIVDYLQLMKGPKSENRQQEVAEISRGLKFLARDLSIPVLALAQLNRRSESDNRGDERPRLSDLRESGSLEQDADMVLIVYRKTLTKPDDPTLDRQAEIIIAKNRQGPTGVIPVSFTKEYTLFSNLTTDSTPEGETVIEEEQESFA